MSDALAAGVIVLVCAACIIADVVLEHIHRARQRVDDRHAAEDSHRNLMRELHRHKGDA